MKWSKDTILSSFSQSRDRLEYKDESGKTALTWAASQGSRAIVGLLINKNVDINATDNHNNTPLIYAAAIGDAWMVERLVTSGANIIHKNALGKNVMDYAIHSGSQEVVNLLVTCKEFADSSLLAYRTKESCDMFYDSLIAKMHHEDIALVAEDVDLAFVSLDADRFSKKRRLERDDDQEEGQVKRKTVESDGDSWGQNDLTSDESSDDEDVIIGLDKLEYHFGTMAFDITEGEVPIGLDEWVLLGEMS